MFRILLILALLFVSCYFVMLIRSYEYMNVSELKRQARRGNLMAARVYRVRGAYGQSLWILLWGVVAVATVATTLLLEDLTWAWAALLINIPFLVLVHGVLPWSKWPEPSLKLASLASPVVERALRFLSPLLSVTTGLIGRWIEPEKIRIVHSKEELLEILRHTEMADQVSRDEVKIAASALTFGDETIGSVMTPLSVTKMVEEGEILSPILLDELHDSGFSRFPVKSKKGDYVGTLYFKDAVTMRASPPVKEVMRQEVYYVNEAALLDHGLRAFLKTQHHLFLVVNEFEDVVGVISIEDILERIIGRKIVDEFDQYDDLRAVARKIAEDKQADRSEETIE